MEPRLNTITVITQCDRPSDRPTAVRYVELYTAQITPAHDHTIQLL